MIAIQIPRTQPPRLWQGSSIEDLMRRAVTDRPLGATRWTLARLRAFRAEADRDDLDLAESIARARRAAVEVVWHDGTRSWYAPDEAPDPSVVLLDALRQNGAAAELFTTPCEVQDFLRTYSGHQALAAQALVWEAACALGWVSTAPKG
jgi:hypothetical protein